MYIQILIVFVMRLLLLKDEVSSIIEEKSILNI